MKRASMLYRALSIPRQPVSAHRRQLRLLTGALFALLTVLLPCQARAVGGSPTTPADPPDQRELPLLAPVVAAPVSESEARPEFAESAAGPVAEPADHPVAAASRQLPVITPSLTLAPAEPAPRDLPAITPVATLLPVTQMAPAAGDFELLDTAVAPGTLQQLTWFGSETFMSAAIPSAVLVAHGQRAGPVVCLTAAVHGDELNGIETVRRVMHDLDPARLAGTVIGVPIVNIQGFNRGSRYLPDRRDLNRYFPGNRTGSSASRIANSLFQKVITACDALVDLHTGSFHRANLPQVRADLTDPGVLALTRGFGSMVVLHGDGAEGTLRRAANDAGIPAVTLEAGGPLAVQEDAVSDSVQGIRTLLDYLGVYEDESLRLRPAATYYQSSWVRTDHGGILSSKVSLGTEVRKGDLLGTVVDPMTNQLREIRSSLHGRVIGMALNQFVMPGYATFHIGLDGPAAPDGDERGEHTATLEAGEGEQDFDAS